MSVGIKVSAEGRNVNRLYTSYDDTTYPSPRDLIFSSDWVLFKTIATGTAVLNAPSSVGTNVRSVVTVPHDLGYAPAVMLYFTPDGTRWYTNNTNLEDRIATATEYRFIQCYSDTDNIYLEAASGNVAAYDLTIRWLIYGEPSSE